MYADDVAVIPESVNDLREVANRWYQAAEGNGRLPIKGHTFIIDWKNLFAKKSILLFKNKLELSKTL